MFIATKHCLRFFKFCLGTRYWRVMLLFSSLMLLEGPLKMLHNARYNAHLVVLMPLSKRFTYAIGWDKRAKVLSARCALGAVSQLTIYRSLWICVACIALPVFHVGEIHLLRCWLCLRYVGLQSYHISTTICISKQAHWIWVRDGMKLVCCHHSWTSRWLHCGARLLRLCWTEAPVPPPTSLQGPSLARPH